MKNNPIYLKVGVIFIILLLLAIFVKGKAGFSFPEIISSLILVLAVFIFGFFVASSVEDRKGRINALKTHLRAQDSKLFNLFHLAKYFDSETNRRVKEKIDEYLMMQIDYKIVDIGKTSKKLSELFEFVRNIQAITDIQKEVKVRMLVNLEEISAILKEASYQARDRMSKYEWVGILVLYFTILFSLYYGNNNTILSIIVISILAASMALFLLILRELDNLQWQEQDWIWEPLTQLFQELGLVPYFPEILFSSKRISLKKLEGLKEVRVAHYKHPYPDFRDKMVKIVKL